MILKLAKKVEIPTPLPTTDVEGTLLERGMYAVLQRELAPARAKAAVVALRKAYEDYNEARVSQPQEIARVIAPAGKPVAQVAKLLPAARLAKEYLQVVFQETHGLDIEGLSEDPVGLGRQLSSIQLLGAEITSFLLYVAEAGELPILSGSVRVLDRLGAMTRTSSVRKARELLDQLVPAKNRLGFAIAMGIVADRWCDSRKPMCWECPLLDDCKNGKKVYKDWKVQQERLAKQREREEVRQVAMAKKEEARLKREAEREEKLRAASERKRKRAADKAKREVTRRRELERKKREAERKKEAATKKMAAARQKAAAKKKAAKKKTATKKTKKKVTKKKAAKKKATKKTAKKAAKKATKKKPTNKKTAKKATNKKATAKKATKKKGTAKKATAKKATKKKGTAKKATKKKTSARKASRKKATRKVSRKR